MTFPQAIALIPLDQRPVCAHWPQQLAAMAGLELRMPPLPPTVATVTGLRKPVNTEGLLPWLAGLPPQTPLIASLDTVLYGGLIPSRLGCVPVANLLETLDQFLGAQPPGRAVYGFSSILRIPDYANAEEEPDYWKPYGPWLYRYSVETHQYGQASLEVLAALPAEIVQDFMDRRQRNAAVNMEILNRASAGLIDYVSLCQDDTGAYGMNVQEADTLRATIAQTPALQARAHVQTGADEVAGCMLARVLHCPYKVFPVYSSPEGRQVLARFDGVAIEHVVRQQLDACGAQLAATPEEADVWLLVHVPTPLIPLTRPSATFYHKGERDVMKNPQGDHCEGIAAKTQPEQIRHVLAWLSKAKEQSKPVILADVAYANGSDPALTAALLSYWQNPDDWELLYGYAGWNTPGNSIGSALSMGLIRFWAEQHQRFNSNVWRKMLLIRLADDALYQSEVRRDLRAVLNGRTALTPADERLLNALMADGLALLQQRLGVTAPVSCRFPYGRSFEVEVNPLELVKRV